jgi:hypothetical protein
LAVRATNVITRSPRGGALRVRMTIAAVTAPATTTTMAATASHHHPRPDEADRASIAGRTAGAPGGLAAGGGKVGGPSGTMTGE